MKMRFNYLSHIYSEKRRPNSDYPKKLAEHLLSHIETKNKDIILDYEYIIHNMNNNDLYIRYIYNITIQNFNY